MNGLSPQQLFEHARTALIEGRLGEAEMIAAAILERHRGDFGACMIMADIAGQVGQRSNELAWIGRAVAADPKNARARAHYGRRLLHAGDLRAALKELETAQRRMTDDPGVNADLIASLNGLGRHEAADRLLRPLLSRSPVAPEIAAVAVNRLSGREEHDRAIDLGRQALEQKMPRPAVERTLRFALAHALEHAKRFEEAFEEAQRANFIQAPLFLPLEFEAEVDRIIALTDRARLQTVPASTKRHERPVFIIGMPRSGARLLERLLAAHPSVHAAGELGLVNGLLDAETGHQFPECLSAFTAETSTTIGDRYLGVLDDVAPFAARIINRELFNFWYLGLIDRVMPGARVIVCRRDPNDTLISCFMTDLNATSAPFSFDPHHIEVVQRGIDRLLAHWREATELPIHDVHYEALVSDPSKILGEVTDFLGLPPLSPEASKAHADLHDRSIGRARGFAALLQTR